MSVEQYLYSEDTHQFVHVSTTSNGCPTGTQAHYMAIQFYTVAHQYKSLRITGNPLDGSDSDAIEWTLGNCVELFCRLTGEGVDPGMKTHIENLASKFEDDNYPNKLRYETQIKGLEYYGLVHEFTKD